MKKRVWGLLLVMFLAIGGTTGCGIISESGSENEESAESAEPTEEELAYQAYVAERSSTFQNLKGTWTLEQVCTTGEWESYNKWYNNLTNSAIDFLGSDGDALDGIVGGFLKGTGAYKEQITITADEDSIDLTGLGGRIYSLTDLEYWESQFSDGTPCYCYEWTDTNGNGVTIRYDYTNKVMCVFDVMDGKPHQETGMSFER